MWRNQQYVKVWPNAEQLAALWKHLRAELGFRTVIHYRAHAGLCWIENLVHKTDFNTCSIVWQNFTNAPYLKSDLDTDIFGIACVDSKQFVPLLVSLSTMLNHMREVPLLIQIHQEESVGNDALQLSERILRFCQKLQMPNVLLLFDDFFKTGNIFAYDIFPEFRLVSRAYNSRRKLYPYKLDNLQGAPIRAIWDETHPYTVIFKDRKGHSTIGGYVWRFMKVFASQLNATLESFVDKAPTLKSSYAHMMQQLQNGTADITTDIYPYYANQHVISTPVAISSLCVMLPAERVVSPREALVGVLESPWIWVYLGIIYCLASFLLGRLKRGSSFMIIILRLIKLILLCAVTAQLTAMLSHPQKIQVISTFDQVEAANLKIVGLRAEFNRYPDEIRIKHATSFISYENFTKFVLLRDSLNTSFAYTVYGFKWNYYAQAQMYFKRPIFRYSTHMCIVRTSMNYVLYKENFLHRHQFNIFIHWMRQSGLLRFHADHSFFDLLRVGSVKLQDLSTQHEVKPVRYCDVDIIALLYGYAMAISFLIFVFELLLYYINVYLDIL